jgi:hypothetical protein
MSDQKPTDEPKEPMPSATPAQPELPKMPQRLEKFPLDSSRGDLPIFYTVRMDKHGTPFFTQVDYQRREECIVNRKCGICGEELGDDIVCVGAADEKTARVLSFAEAAMHEECAMYAIKACPYLRTPGYLMREQRQVPEGETIEPLDRFTAARPPKLALYFLSDYRAYRYKRESIHRVGGRGDLRRPPLEF